MNYFPAKSAIIGAILASTALAVPTPQQGIGDPFSCAPEQVVYKDVQWGSPFDKPPVMAAAVRCTSSKSEACEISREYAHTVSIENSLNVGAALGVDLNKVLNFGLSLGYTRTWSTSDSKASGSTIICPSGGFTCGIQAIERVVEVTGQVSVPGDCSFSTFNSYKFTAPYKEGDGADGSSGVITFRVCLMNCEAGDSCLAAIDAGLPKCPSPDAYVPFEGHFGGEPGYIPIDQAGQQGEQPAEQPAE